MFEQMLLPEGGTHQKRNAALVFAGQVLLAAFVVLVVPGLFVLPLPTTDLVTELVAPPPPPPPPPPAAPAVTRTVRAAVKPAPREFNIQQFIAPKAIPQEPAIVAAAPALTDAGAAGGVPGGIPGGVPGGVLGGTVGGVIGAPPAPAPAPVQAQVQPAAATPSQIRIGGNVQAAKLTHEVQPEYPRLAKDAHVMGTVRLSATIASNGTVKDLHVLSGNPLLVGAAMNAVKQWTYQPTVLNGKPVEVLTEVDVKFTLA